MRHVLFRYCLEPVSLISIGLYLLNRWVIKPVTGIGFFHDYFNDLLCFPIFLPAVLLLHRGLGLRNHDRPLTAFEIGFHLAAWSVYFEGIAPLMTGTYRTTADPLDVAAYAAGALFAGLMWGSWRAVDVASGCRHARRAGASAV